VLRNLNSSLRVKLLIEYILAFGNGRNIKSCFIKLIMRKQLERRLCFIYIIIIILRNPIERAFSAYKHVSRGMKECLSFEEALFNEDSRLKEDCTLTPMTQYKNMGLYHNMVNSYIQSFKNVHVLLYDEFSNNTAVELKKIYQFLNIDDSVNVNYNKKYNVASGLEWNNNIVKSLILKNTRFKRNIKKFFRKEILTTILAIITYTFKSKSLSIKNSTKKELRGYFYEDIIKLSKLINKDLSLWLK
jgi:hypothetical protein